MMIAFLMMQAAGLPAGPSIDGLPIAPLPRQSLPARGCAAYLFTTGTTRALAAMVSADPAQLRVAIDDKVVDLPRVEADATGNYGFGPQANYRIEGVSVMLEMTIEPRSQLSSGAAVPIAVLRLDRPGRDTVAVPMAGLIGCVT